MPTLQTWQVAEVHHSLTAGTSVHIYSTTCTTMADACFTTLLKAAVLHPEAHTAHCRDRFVAQLAKTAAVSHKS